MLLELRSIVMGRTRYVQVMPLYIEAKNAYGHDFDIPFPRRQPEKMLLER